MKIEIEVPNELVEQSHRIFVGFVNKFPGWTKGVLYKDRELGPVRGDVIDGERLFTPTPDLLPDRVMKTVDYAGWEIRVKAPEGVSDFKVDGLRADLVVIPEVDIKHISVHLWPTAEGAAKDEE